MMLPSDRYIANLLGLTEEEYRYYQREVQKRAAEGPQPSVVAGTEIIIASIALALSIGSAIVSILLRPQIPDVGGGGQPKRIKDQTDPIKRTDRFAQNYGFDSQQDISTIGTRIPVVYSKRELIDGVYYGGVRISTPMVWNQILSLGRGQLLRAVFLLGEGVVASLDPDNFAIGSNILSGYKLESYDALLNAARVSVYFRGDGGRINDSHNVFGRRASEDAGSSSSADTFSVYWNEDSRKDFCASFKPSNQTTFGVHSPIGNNLAYKVNPSVRPGVRSQYKPKSSERMRVRCPFDSQQMNERDKARAFFSTYGGIVGGQSNGRMAYAGELLTYKLLTTSLVGPNRPNNQAFVFDNFHDDNLDAGADALGASDVASTVAGLQRNWDSNLTVGDIYKIGEAVAVCISRTEQPFVSDSELSSGSGNEVTAVFRVIEDGQITTTTENILNDETYLKYTLNEFPGLATDSAAKRYVGTNGAHLFKYASAYVVSSRSCQAVEFGLRSILGSRLNGLCNFQDLRSFKDVDQNYCKAYTEEEADEIVNVAYQSGIISAPFEKYSFFRIKWRKYGEEKWTTLKNTYGVRGESQQAIFTYIRIEFQTLSQREFRFEPLTGYEIRNSLDGGLALYILDPSLSRNRLIENDCIVIFNGESVARSANTFGIKEAEAVATLKDFYAYKEATNGYQNTMNILNTVTIPANQTTVTGLRFNNPVGVAGQPRVYIGSGQSEAGTLAGITGTLTRLSTSSPFATTPADPVDEGFTFEASTTSANVRTIYASSTFFPTNDHKIVLYKGLQPVDDDTYIDDYAKLAELFTYSEVVSSADSGPEHEIVYVNEIVPNEVEPQYDNLALVGINIRSSTEWRQFSQFSSYVTGGKECKLMAGGTGPTHLFPEVLYDLMTNSRFGAGHFIKPYMINESDFKIAAEWCQSRKYFYDAGISEQINIRSFAADLAATHLLTFGESDGRYFLKPAITFDLVQPKGIFTAGNISEGTFDLQYLDLEDRAPAQISVRYREERLSTDPTNPGLFPLVREVLVRESIGSDTDPIQQLDMSDYCTSKDHAIDAAKFLLRMKRIPDHIVSFQTTFEGAMSSLAPGDYIKVSIDETEYETFNNGAVQADGTLVSTKSLSDGTYQVFAWSGVQSEKPSLTTLEVKGGTATPANIIFTVVTSSTKTKNYQIESISAEEDGAFTIRAMHMPLTQDGILQVADGFDMFSNWIIED